MSSEPFAIIPDTGEVIEFRRPDLGLPGESGFVAMERFQANPYLATIPIIIVSGRPGHDNRVRAMKTGAKAFLEKPVDSDELMAAIRQALGESSEPEKSVVTSGN